MKKRLVLPLFALLLFTGCVSAVKYDLAVKDLDERTKELLGLATSMVLKCDDCVTYHILRCVRLGVTDDQLLEALNVALVVGGSITIPHIRRAVETMDACRKLSQKELDALL